MKRRPARDPFQHLDDPDEAPGGAADPKSRRHNRPPPEGETALPLDAIRWRRRPQRPETECDPEYVIRGTLLVEANARLEGERHAKRDGRLRIKHIPEPFLPAYIDGFWSSMEGI